ncbi:uncharacterized protein LOC107821556 [Nicotiana tabacum]|uniref:Uncharacterized protein LOC107821556 n=2 Tax=Nicotiana TaxID=4085 RepID=A0A1S4CR28_TOBAC
MKDAAKFDDPAIFQVSPSYEEVTMDLLFGGHNKGFAVLAKVLYPVNNEKVYPLYYVLCDTNLDCFVLTVHGIHAMAIQRGDVIILLDPYYSLVNFEWQGKLYHFKSVRVNLPNQVLVNGEAVPNHFAIRQPLGRKPKAWGL